MRKVMLLLAGAFGALSLAACEMQETAQDASQDEAAPETASEVTVSEIDYAAIVANPGRSEADRDRDDDRKPAETLAFFEIGPGDSVFEIEAGGGYFTELYSLAVGPSGAVAMQNFQGFADYAKEEIDARLAGDRLANVRVTISLHDDLDAEDNSVDVASWVQGPHELYYKPSPDAHFGDPAGSFAEIFRIVKPGGIFGVIDHSAVAGAPVSVGNELHRIDRAHIVDLATKAGFVLEAESDFLANLEDDRTTLAFAEEIRGKTDQFALRFTKPE